jgi:TorA maturation chaperone TorD
MEQTWLNKAALYEILAKGFILPTKELAEVLVGGEYADAMKELAKLNGLHKSTYEVAIEELSSYAAEKDVDKIFHQLRVEYTDLYVGSPTPKITPYAGVWLAGQSGDKPLLFVNNNSMAIERFMQSCGVGQPEGGNSPLDHIGTLLEFLQYLCLVFAGVAKPAQEIVITEDTYDEFITKYFHAFSQEVASLTIDQAQEPFYRAIARTLALT